MKRRTHCDRVLELLADGKPHLHIELYRLGVIAHSRVADLRRRGYQIAAWRHGDDYCYQLVGSPALEDPPVMAVPHAAPQAGGSSSAAAPSTSRADVAVPRRAVVLDLTVSGGPTGEDQPGCSPGGVGSYLPQSTPDTVTPIIGQLKLWSVAQ